MDVYENTSEYVHKNKRSIRTISRRATENNTEDKATAAGARAVRLVIVSFGLLCILQASLNVGLRLYLETSNTKTSEERNELQKNYSILIARTQHLLEEKEELQRLNSFLNMSYQNVSEERDEIQKKYSLLNMSHHNVTEEREELKIKLSYLSARHAKKFKENDQDRSYFRGSIYYGSETKLSWEESRRFCQEEGADLIIINSKEEQDFVRIFGGRRWIGLSDRESEGDWKWVDESLLKQSFWYSGEPNDEFGEDCVEIKMDLTGNNWNDMPCNKKQDFICEMKIAF